MAIDAQRDGWPEQVLTGRYTFGTRRRDYFAALPGEALSELIGTDTGPGRDQLHVRVDGHSVMVVMRDRGGAWAPAPAGPKVCGIERPGPLLSLVRRPRVMAGWQSWFAPRVSDVLDNRLGTIVGTLHTTGGVVRPARTVIAGPTGRVAGHMTQPVLSWACQLPQLFVGFRMLRFTFTVDGRRVAHLRHSSRRWMKEFRADVSRSGGLLDPRLILACGVEQLARFSSY
ncbi:hypothetical protein Asp14428_66150 [Actinoplanes sp. NBRC 14428]|nr:hypothetical protein Asp14428_66150 [Actinoplanes sp. NBRC 14428]